MKALLSFALLFSFTARAQFESYDNILAPGQIAPKIGIVCKVQVMFSTTDLVIDVYNGLVTQVIGENNYIYQLESFSLEKVQGDKNGSKLDFKAKLTSVIEKSSGNPSKDKIKQGNLIFSSYLPKKDGKKFSANKLDIAIKVGSKESGFLDISNNSTNSTKCELVRGGKLVKEISKENVYKFAATMKVDDSDRNQPKEIQSGSKTGSSKKNSMSSKQ